jgi:hypothetical protein
LPKIIQYPHPGRKNQQAAAGEQNILPYRNRQSHIVRNYSKKQVGAYNSPFRNSVPNHGHQTIGKRKNKKKQLKNSKESNCSIYIRKNRITTDQQATEEYGMPIGIEIGIGSTDHFGNLRERILRQMAGKFNKKKMNQMDQRNGHENNYWQPFVENRFEAAMYRIFPEKIFNNRICHADTASKRE